MPYSRFKIEKFISETSPAMNESSRSESVSLMFARSDSRTFVSFVVEPYRTAAESRTSSIESVRSRDLRGSVSDRKLVTKYNAVDNLSHFFDTETLKDCMLSDTAGESELCPLISFFISMVDV